MLEFDLGALKRQPGFGEQTWGAPANFDPAFRSSWRVAAPLYLHDTTLRDGEQTPGVAFTTDEKVRIARALDAVGVGVIEAGLPMLAKDFAAIERLAGALEHATLACLVRAVHGDIDAAANSGVKLAVVEHTVNPYACRLAYGLDEAGLIERNVEAIRYAHEKGLEVNWMGWDTFRQSFDYVERVFRAVVEQGQPERVTVADTFGMLHPLMMGERIAEVKSWFPDRPVELHVHNDCGMATANALVALTSGASAVHTCVNGLGERAGNAALEEVAAAGQLALGLDLGIDLKGLAGLSRLVADCARREPAWNKPVVGSNLFNVDSGLIVHLFRKADEAGFPRTIMLPFLPEAVGRDDFRIVPGKGAGRASVAVLLERLGLQATDRQVADLVDALKAECTLRKTFLTDAEFERLARSVIAS